MYDVIKDNHVVVLHVQGIPQPTEWPNSAAPNAAVYL
jgi:hypothetical protein